MGKIRCPECRYRAAKFSDYTCDYAGITGHTRRPSRRSGAGILSRSSRRRPQSVRSRKGPPSPSTQAVGGPRYDWEKAKMLYDQKWSDSKIAAAMGCDVNSVLAWRKREKLPPWPRSVQIVARKEVVV